METTDMTTDTTAVVAGRTDALGQMFPARKPIIGTIHLLPLPGSPRYRGESMAEIVDRAVTDAAAYVEGGCDGLIVENEGDMPFLRQHQIGPETVASLTVATAAVAANSPVPVGVMCLANAALQSIAIAKATGSTFIRANQWANAYIANEGYIEGAAAETLRLRSAIYAHDVKVLADVHVKHGSHAIVADRTVAEQTLDVEAFDADVLIATGERTGDPTRVEEVMAIKESATLPVIVGSGLDADRAKELMTAADGAIVGSAMKVDGKWWNPVELSACGASWTRLRRSVDERGASSRRNALRCHRVGGHDPPFPARVARC